MIIVGVRSMEFCRRHGLSDSVINWGFPKDHSLDNVFVTNLNGHEIGRIRMPTMGEYRPSRYSPEAQAYCPQTWFDPILRERAASFKSVILRYRCRLEEFEQSSTGIRAIITDLTSGKRETIRTDYLAGADGHASLVRRQLGIEMRGQAFLDNSINIELNIPNLESLHDKGRAGRWVMVGPEGTWATFISVDGRDLYRITIYNSSDTGTKGVDLDAAIRRAVGLQGFDYAIRSVGHWVRRAVVADRFQDGRVFLLGDAGHTHPPNGGFGMNTGIGDAENLGWKLAAVLQGWGGDHLLESYDLERRAACHRAMSESLANYGRLVGNTALADVDKAGPAGERIRRELGARLVQDNTRAWRPVGIHLGLMYDPSPIVVSDHSERPQDDTVGYVPTSRPGSRAPHGWLPDGRSILDLFREHHVLLRFGRIPRDGSPLIRAARAIGLPIQQHDIADPNLRDLYEAPLVLVRPDGHVAWRGERIPAAVADLVDRLRGAGRPVAARWADDPAPTVQNTTLALAAT
jgi:2-polyprenyl-6-methoxyphenol hydroxylase-like FAD-dependent oxidoreductase